MVRLFGENYEKEELLERIGDMNQLCGIKIIELREGRAKGVEVARFWTGSGLEFDVALSRGMGIGAFRYKGVSMGWISPTGDVAPSYYEPEESGMDRSYSGGLMHNGGLRQVGAPCVDEGERLGLHGRIANLPAENIHAERYWDGDEYCLCISGAIKEVSALGENLVLKRKITTKLSGQEIIIEDVVENAGFQPSPFMILYHTNFGFPLIDAGTKLIIPSIEVLDADGGKPVDESVYGSYGKPSSEPSSQIFFHNTKAKKGWSKFLIVNYKLGIGLSICYEKKNLPQLINWVNLEKGRYVVEVGPSNCKCFGRKSEREAGTLEYIKPGETKDFKMIISIIEGKEKLEQTEKEIRMY